MNGTDPGVDCRPLFLVASDDGIVGVWSDESMATLSPTEAAGLGRSASRHDTVTPVDGVRSGSISPPCPLVLSVRDDCVEAWSPRLARRVEVDAGQLEVLATPNHGVDADSSWGERLAPLVAAGVLVLRDTGGPTGPFGYLQPTAVAVEVGTPAPPVAGLVPVYSACPSHIAGVPLAGGMLVAAVAAHDGGRLTRRFDLRPLRRDTPSIVAEVAANPVPSVSLHSNYLWSISENLELAAAIKRIAPGSITVHGGPSTPKYESDIEAFLDANPAVDILVLGEGEVTIVEVLDRLADRLDPDLVVGVPGTVVRRSDGTTVRGPDRDRIPDLGGLPSPFLTGLFDHLDGGLLDMMTVETNRGCPYGCTFCDWGSATMSRIRHFPLDRVAAELEWIAARGVGTLFIADANFGIVPRDLEIARILVDLRRRYGAPHTVLVSFAKNQTMRAVDIVRTWIEGGIVTEGSIALQTSDESTLRAIRRANIKVERYDELTEAFQRLGLPLAVDLMMGLPGSTLAGFRSDLQRCIDRELTARIYPTVVLPNSPMNESGYRTEHAIRVDDSGVVIGTSSFDDAGYDAMLRLRRVYRAADHFGVLRHVARWLQLDHGVDAMTFYSLVEEVVRTDPERWPSLVWVARHLPRWTVPPAGWSPMLAEVSALLVEHLGLADDDALHTALVVQEAHLPWPGRQFPAAVDLRCDYVSWYRAHSQPGSQRVGPLASFGSATLTVSDPRGICGSSSARHFRAHPHPDIDSVMQNEFWIADDWELASPLTRRLPQVLVDEMRSSDLSGVESADVRSEVPHQR